MNIKGRMLGRINIQELAWCKIWETANSREKSKLSCGCRFE